MAGMCTAPSKSNPDLSHHRLGSGAMDPLLVITNSDAGTADEESLEAALRVLRNQDRRRGRGHRRPRRAGRRAAPGRLAPDRGRGWRRQPARGDLLPLQAPRPRPQRARPAAARHRQRLRPRGRDPARHRGGRSGAARRHAPADGPDRRRGRRRSRSTACTSGAGAAGQPPRGQLEGSGGVGKNGSATRSARPSPPGTRPCCGCGSSSTARWSTTSTDRCSRSRSATARRSAVAPSSRLTPTPPTVSWT